MPLPTPPTTNQPAANSSQIQQLNNQNLPVSTKGIILRALVETELARTRQQAITTSAVVSAESSGQTPVSIAGNASFSAASLNKLPVALLIEQDIRSGKLQPTQTLTWTANDIRPGNGKFDKAGAATTATVNEVLFDMLNPSGNTAVRVLVNKALGGPDAVNQRLAAQPGIKVTRLERLTADSFYLGNTTANESLGILRALMATPDTTQAFIKNALATNTYTDFGTRSQLTAASGITLVNKVGILDDTPNNVRHDVGLIYNDKTGAAYSYAFLTSTPSANNPNGSGNEEASLQVLGSNALRYAGDKSQGGVGDAIRKQVNLYSKPVRY